MKPRLTREGQEILAADLDKLDVRSDRELRDSWQHLFGTEPPKRIDRSLLIQGIGYRMQENAVGGLKPSTRRLLGRAAETVARGGKVRSVSNRVTKPGTVLIREWGGVTNQVTVEEHGMLFRGQHYRSLSEIARLITGARWSGPLFFGLRTVKERTRAAG